MWRKKFALLTCVCMCVCVFVFMRCEYVFTVVCERHSNNIHEHRKAWLLIGCPGPGFIFLSLSYSHHPLSSYWLRISSVCILNELNHIFLFCSVFYVCTIPSPNGRLLFFFLLLFRYLCVSDIIWNYLRVASLPVAGRQEYQFYKWNCSKSK